MQTIKKHFLPQDILALLFITLFLIIGVLTLPFYGLTFDEGLGNLFFGQRYLFFFLTRDATYLDFMNGSLEIHQRDINLFLSPFKGGAHEFPPFVDTLSALTMEIFGYKLEVLDPIDAFHLFTIFLATILLCVIYLFCRRYIDLNTGLLAIIFLGSYPRFWADMHFNGKDIGQTVLYSLTLIAYFIWYKNPTPRKAIGCGLLLGCALATKANALFIPFTLLLGIWPIQLAKYPWTPIWNHLKQTYKHYILMAISFCTIYFLSWPYLYANPLRVKKYFDYIFSQGGRQGELKINWDPTIQALSTMPEIIILLLGLGIVFIILNRKQVDPLIPRFLIIWFLFPILRSSLPGTVNFDGIRHFEEFVPAACILAAYGGVSLVNFLARKTILSPKVVAPILIALIVANLLYIHTHYFPFQNVYFNTFVGGLTGAHTKLDFPEATDYWASSYRQGMNWLNDNAENNAHLYVSFAPWLIDITEEAWLRDDIQVVKEDYFHSEADGSSPVYIMFVTRTRWYNRIVKQVEEQFVPVHEIIIDGTPILKIYRLESISSELVTQ